MGTGNQGSELKCTVCRYCIANTGEDTWNGYYCINEQSERFGQVVTKSGTKPAGPGCDKYEHTNHKAIQDMSLKDALQMVIMPPLSRSYPFYQFKFKTTDSNGIWEARFFETNKDLLDYRDAVERLFDELMKLKEQDGDFDD